MLGLAGLVVPIRHRRVGGTYRLKLPTQGVAGRLINK
jgi:hypothetical protein